MPFDALLAVLLLAVGQWQIFFPDQHRVIANPLLSAVIWGVTASALAWRRRFPWQTFTVVILGLTLEALPGPDSGTLAGYVALCVVLYTVARAEVCVERTVAATAIAVLALLFHYARDPLASNAVESIQATYVILLACPVVALLIAGRATRATALESELAVGQQRQEEAARLAATAERARISRELHDVIAHSVSVTIVQSMAAQSAIGDGHLADAQRRLGSIEEAARSALADMRRLVAIDATEASVASEAQPRMATLDGLVQRLRDSGAQVQIEKQGPWTDVPLGADLALFRITQEALTNAVNHAPGAAIWIRLTDQDGFVASDVTNGPGTGYRPGRRARRRAGTARHARASPPLWRDPAGRTRAGRRISGTRGVANRRSQRMITVLLADDQALVREGFRALIDRETDMNVLAEADNGDQAVQLSRQHRPDVVLMDIRMPGTDGLQATARILAENATAPRVLILTTFDQDDYLYQALRAGASGFLLKDVRQAQLINAIRTVHADEALFAPVITRRLIEHFCRRPAPITIGQSSALSTLTPRELDILTSMARGLSNAELAQRLFLSESTIKTHVGRVLHKIQARDRVQAVVFAYETGLVEPGSPGANEFAAST